MRIHLLLAALICFSSCHRTKKASIDQNEKTGVKNQIVNAEFQSIIGSADVIGAILLYDYK